MTLPASTLPRVLLAVLVLTLVVTGAATAASLLRGPPSPRLAASVPQDRGEPGALEVLHAWDARRAAAWAAGDVGALRALYVPGARAGRRDVAMLRAWERRDVRVRGLRMQVLAVRVLARSGHRLVLLVTDRLAGGTAVRGSLRTPLPRDRATTRRIAFSASGGRWRVAAVGPAPPTG
ncbi:hypothetical protein H5V45_20060 [Nocardioides sp. KIGAM211]|uniref:SnoaL-like domain-containing protein n=1 Tax=Nocardioides luti TaxID=2761101 RepID=A0A7X0VCB7_9ACTN|nr:hypothetical protein [Nocardioides luti]MBB6629624.1 hypothetical protein [Nocardioides luti]